MTLGLTLRPKFVIGSRRPHCQNKKRQLLQFRRLKNKSLRACVCVCVCAVRALAQFGSCSSSQRVMRQQSQELGVFTRVSQLQNFCFRSTIASPRCWNNVLSLVRLLPAGSSRSSRSIDNPSSPHCARCARHAPRPRPQPCRRLRVFTNATSGARANQINCEYTGSPCFV